MMMNLDNMELISKAEIKKLAEAITEDPIEGAVMSRVCSEIGKCLKKWDSEVLDLVDENLVWRGVNLSVVSGRTTKEYPEDIQIKKLELRKQKLRDSMKAIDDQIASRQEYLEESGKVTLKQGPESLRITIL